MIILETANGYLITGNKTFNDLKNKLLYGKPNANCLVVITDSNKTTEFVRTVTDIYGNYKIEQSFTDGIYRMTFYGTGKSDDFEQFTIKNSSAEFDMTPPDNTDCDLLTNLI